MAGSKTRIEFRSLLEIIKPPCEDKPSRRNLKVSTILGKHHFYHTVSACTNLLQQNRLANVCGCVDASLPVGEFAKNLPYCKRVHYHNVSVSSDTILKRLQCMNNTTSVDVDDFTDDCPLNCRFIKYRTNVFESKWPTNVGQSEFYEKFIKTNVRHLKRFPTKNGIFTKNSKAYLENNFLKVELFRSDFSATIMTEEPVMTLPNLFSQIGGTLALWSGFSLIVVVELSECLFYIGKNVFASR